MNNKLRTLLLCLTASLANELMAQNAPTVITNPRFARGATMAFGRIEGNPAVNGGSAIVKRGFCLSTNPEPTVDDTVSTKTISNNGIIYYFQDLKPATMYYMRAYATNKDGLTGYGEVIKFSTVPKGNVTYWYNNGGDANANKRINDAATKACQIFNDLTSIRKKFNIGYSAGTPTADCYYDDEPWMNMGANSSYQRTGTIMHEMQHGMGVIPYTTQWSGNILREGNGTGHWLGERVSAFLDFWDNTTGSRLNGDTQHMWPYGVNGANEDDGQVKTYYANAMIGQALGEDGLEHRSDVFAEPCYVFLQEDTTKYYLKNESEDRGLYSSFLIPNADGQLKWRAMTAEEATGNDSVAWYITFTPSNQYYQLRNAATGQYMTYGGGIKTAAHATPANTDNFHLMRGRVDVLASADKAFRGYWIIHPTNDWNPKALQANDNGNTSAPNFNIENGAKAQRWLILTAEEAFAFEEEAVKVSKTAINNELVQLKTLLEVPHYEIVAGTDQKLQSTISSAEEALATATAAELTGMADDVKSAAIDFLGGVQATDPEKPFDLTYLLKSPVMTSTDGWSGDLPALNYSCGEFYEKTFNFNQTIKGLPAGAYIFSVQAFQRPGDATTAYTNYSAGKDGVTAYIYAGSKSQKIASICVDAQSKKLGGKESTVGSTLYVPNDMQAASKYFAKGLYQNKLETSVATAGGSLKVGVRSSKMDSKYWVIFNNFALSFYGDHVPDENEATGINDVSDALRLNDKGQLDRRDGVYDLQGRRISSTEAHSLSAPYSSFKKGIYIKNGRKIVVR